MTLPLVVWGHAELFELSCIKPLCFQTQLTFWLYYPTTEYNQLKLLPGVAEVVTAPLAALLALRLSLHVCLAVAVVPAPPGLGPPLVHQAHAGQAGLVAGGQGVHRELVVLRAYVKPGREVDVLNSFSHSLKECFEELLAVKDSSLDKLHNGLQLFIINEFFLHMQALGFWVKSAEVLQLLSEANMDVQLVGEEHPGPLLTTVSTPCHCCNFLVSFKFSH